MYEAYWAPYERNFSAAFVSAAGTWKLRKGLILKYREGDANWRYAEASPLPGYSRDSYAQVEEVLKVERWPDLVEQFENKQLPPSLQFAFDSLFYHFEPWKENVSTNAVFGLDQVNEQNFIHQYESGYRVFKLKITPQSWESTLPLIKQWHTRITFRLDCNSSFSKERFSKIYPLLTTLNIEYVEDPLENWQEVEKEWMPIIAVDRDLSSWDALERFLNTSINTLIIKPTVLGGLELSRKAQAKAQKLGKKVVFTSALETEIALLAQIRFAATLLDLPTCGFSTGQMYADNYMASPPIFEREIKFNANFDNYLSHLAWRKFN